MGYVGSRSGNGGSCLATLIDDICVMSDAGYCVLYRDSMAFSSRFCDVCMRAWQEADSSIARVHGSDTIYSYNGHGILKNRFDFSLCVH